MNLIKPRKLKKGDTIAIIAPSGAVCEDKILNAQKYFTDIGYNVKFGKNIFKQCRYMAGTDEERIEDIYWAFQDESINAIVCARGGYGCLRLADKINYDIIASNPKIFCGYSDITVLSLMFLKKTGLITFSSPMPKGDFQPDSLDNFTCDRFWETLSGDEITIKPENLKVYNDGVCQGLLWGGNLASISSMVGLDFIPKEKFVFITEDVNEPVYKIDRYFRQLLNVKEFKDNVSGIALGEFTGIENIDELNELFVEIAKQVNVPVYAGYPVSHLKRKITFPIGGYAQIMCDGIINVRY